jgi:hypothetical protein
LYQHKSNVAMILLWLEGHILLNIRKQIIFLHESQSCIP